MIEKQVGLRIAEIRKNLGMTQEKLAEGASYSTEFISLIERGRNAPSLAGLARIAKALRVEPKDLLNFSARRRA